MTSTQLDQLFTYHPPNESQIVRYQDLREKAKELAKLIVDHCPESREASLAITHLQTANMFANAAIAIHEAEPKAASTDSSSSSCGCAHQEQTQAT
jgi:hypothetical protein